MMVPKAVGVLVLGLDSPISPVVMTARLQDPAINVIIARLETSH